VVSVISGVRSLGTILGADADLLEAAAWLHDIGYTANLANTGSRALDGARYLRDAQHAEAMLCRLVAYQSCAIIEVGERGLATSFLEFEPTQDGSYGSWGMYWFHRRGVRLPAVAQIRSMAYSTFRFQVRTAAAA
jgi:hypothetical protein